MRKYLFVFFFTLQIISTLSLYAIAPLRMTHITTQNGLSHNSVRWIMQDSQGFLWFSTVNGLNRYDGYKMRRYYAELEMPSLTESNVRYTIEDFNQRIWISSTSKRVNCYSLFHENFVEYDAGADSRSYQTIDLLPEGDVWLWGLESGACFIRNRKEKLDAVRYDVDNIGTNRISFVLNDATQQVWIGTHIGLIRLVNGIPTYCNINLADSNYHSVIERHRHLYFFTDAGAIVVYDKQEKVFLPALKPQELKDVTLRHVAAIDPHRVLITGKERNTIFNTTTHTTEDAKPYFRYEDVNDARVLIDNNNNCWVYNKTGYLWHYDNIQSVFDKRNLIPLHVLSVIDAERYNVLYDSRGITWITTYGNGLFMIEQDGETSHFTVDNSDLRTNYLLSITEDRSGSIWVGTEHAGVTKISLSDRNYLQLIPNADADNASDRIVRTLFEDPETKDVWIGTKHGVVYFYDSLLRKKATLPLHKGVLYSISSDTVGNIWLGTKGSGVFILPKGAKTSRLLNFHLLTNDKDANNIYSILCDNKGRMWVGTFGRGLFLCEFTKDGFRATNIPGVTTIQKQIRDLLQDRNGMIWVAGENGVVLFNPETVFSGELQTTWYHFEKNNPRSLNNSIVKAMYEDSCGRIWLGTSGGGLNQAVKDETSGMFSFNHFTSEDGLINNVIQAILEDDNGNLWITTEDGVSKLSVNQMQFENFQLSDSWEGNLFAESAALKRQNGELMFGSHNGLYLLNPLSFKKQVQESSVQLTGLYVNGVEVNPGDVGSPLQQSITQTSQIKLKSTQNSFSIAFSSLNFKGDYSNRYAYILENYDKDWNPVTSYNMGTYKNIPPGKYVFKVRSLESTFHQGGHAETQLQITVVPPFWKSTEAFVLYVLLCAALMFFSFKMVLKMNRLHTAVAVEKQFTEFRLRFFTNISHEFRTPLTIIKGSIENLHDMKSLPGSVKKHIHTLEKSSNKLMFLIDQLLEFRKMQNNAMELHLARVDAASLLRGIFDLFTELSERKHIHFTFAADIEPKQVLLDSDKIEKIIFNLLSNSFKHTHEGGNIALEIVFDPHTQHLVCKVQDSGKGIPADKREQVFERFKQISPSVGGVGIGLNLTAELIRLHKGSIRYDDSLWGGACFTVTIPTNEAVYVDEEKISETEQVKHKSAYSTQEEVYDEQDDLLANPSAKRYKLLLIEDDEDIRLFLENRLKHDFAVSTAANGLAGYEAAIQEEPHLIVCDVMMPEMDGFEVTRRLKSEFQTSHIPIILLTAHSSIEHQLEGITAGADAYVIKPFSTKYLISRIIKLIEQREKLQYKFAHDPGIIQPTICTTNKDHEFIEKIQAVIEKHLANTEFSIDDFAKEVNMGRTLFFKKIKGIANLSPNEYLRIARLKKASELLMTTDLNISEVAYRVGFNDPYYFSKCFKEQFGMRPTQFRKQ